MFDDGRSCITELISKGLKENQLKRVEDLKIDMRSPDCLGRNPLHVASSVGSCELLSFFFGKGISPNAKDREQHTPLHYAAANCHEECVDFLLHLPGVTTMTKNSRGQTPLHLSNQCSPSFWSSFLSPISLPSLPPKKKGGAKLGGVGNFGEEVVGLGFEIDFGPDGPPPRPKSRLVDDNNNNDNNNDNNNNNKNSNNKNNNSNNKVVSSNEFLTQDEDGNTPIHYLAARGAHEVITNLIKEGWVTREGLKVKNVGNLFPSSLALASGHPCTSLHLDPFIQFGSSQLQPEPVEIPSFSSIDLFNIVILRMCRVSIEERLEVGVWLVENGINGAAVLRGQFEDLPPLFKEEQGKYLRTETEGFLHQLQDKDTLLTLISSPCSFCSGEDGGI